MNIEHKYYFPVHLDGDNRGCEGIAKGTAKILGLPKENLIGLCTNTELDTRLGINKYVTLCPSRVPSIIDRLMFHVYPRIWTKEKVRKFNEKYWYDAFIDRIDKSDIMLVTGGDMMCYNDNFINYIVEKLYKKGVKSVLWGASMGQENLSTNKKETLQRFSLIYARETLSRDFFQSMGLKSVICYPDPAFCLEPQNATLPKYFEQNEVIGMNISNFVLGDFTLETPFGEQIKKLIEYILKETRLHILLIPHVLWKGQDDRIVSQNIKAHFSLTDRISILNSEDFNYTQIRYVISQCRYFIGARTHAVISAYSTCVPTIALGYSIKSKGIARDIGISESLVVNSKNTNDRDALINAFKYLRKNENEIRKHLKTIMPEYKTKAIGVRQEMERFIYD